VAVDLLLAGGGELPPEGKTVEYKRDLSSEDTVLRSVVAFANSAGGPLTFDRLVAAEATMADLDIAPLGRLLGREIDEEALLTLELAKREDGVLKPTNAGVLVACPAPHRFYPHAWVQCARFRGPDGLEIADQASIYGPLPLAVDETMAFLRRHRFLRAEFGNGDPNWDWRRKDIPSIPENAIRELVINALVHSSYSYGGSAIKVAFWDESITIENPGGLVPGVTIEQITRGVSVLRNPAVARVFRELDLIEAWGSGLRRIFRDLEDGGFGAPDFAELHERLRVTVHIPNHDPRFFTPSTQRASQPEQEVKQQVEQGEQEVKQEVEQVVEQVGPTIEQVTEEARAILERARQPARRADLLTAAGLSDAYLNYRNHVIPLLDSGLLTRTIPDQPNAHTQRYATTELGEAALAAVQDGES
jgi:predicted HTH transcriptional regulator